jgi:hypothetical protein
MIEKRGYHKNDVYVPLSLSDRIVSILILSGIVYVVALALTCIGGIIYGFITNQSVFVVSKYIVELPALLLILTFIICTSVTIIDYLMHRDKNKEETNQEKGV